MSAGRKVRYRARWILPIVAPPVRDGWVDVFGDAVHAVGGAAAVHPADPLAEEIDLGDVALLPGLVNAHTHLELSGLDDASPPADSMPAWARALVQRVDADGGLPAEAIPDAVAQLHACGTVLVGDIGNTQAALPGLASGRVDAVLFQECLGFEVGPEEAEARAGRLADEIAGRAAGAGGDRLILRGAAHAPYSVSPALFRALVARLPGPRTVHLAESREEIDFLRDGHGPWREFLQWRGRWNAAWEPPGTGPVDYLEMLGWLRDDTLVVHGVQLRPDDLKRLAAAGTTLVTCPRSNRWTGAGEPPVADFYASGVRVAVGTDSLASAPDLNLFSELAALHRLAPAVPASRLLRSATLHGAAALGRGETLGAIAPGRRAALVAVALPGSLDDVEQYLVGGIEPEQIAWVEAHRC
ncbi:MAG: amidohydrolase family protein [Acidobacteria bacterium]|nr:amidohydrolase family protein [Acidobacteriota bacterium]MYJ02804.1 amidohydrolase family protein [Acidobacteriota bacterium]